MFKTTLKWLIAAMVVASMPMLTSCSSDDDGPGSGSGSGSGSVNPSKVFPYGVFTPSTIKSISHNEDGLVDRIVTYEGSTITFDYIKGRANNNDCDVIMKIDDEGDYTEMYLTLNKSGYVKYCLERFFSDYDDENDYCEWWLDYNSDGQLSKVKILEEGESVEMTISHTKGDITKVDVKCDDPEENEYSTFAYTNIENKGGVMDYDGMFNVDLDEMGYAYLAGLLGKATKHLPSKAFQHYDGRTYETAFDWTLNSNGLPSSLEVTWDGYDVETFTFKW